MIVMKFGGTSVEDARAIRRLVNLVRERLQQRPVIVTSALAGVTDALLHAAFTATGGNNQSATQELLERLESRHVATADDLLVDVAQTEANISQLFAELRSLLGVICALRKVTPRLRDRVASFGERLSTELITAALRESGIDATLIDARECIVTDDRYTCAAPLLDTSEQRLRARLIPLLEARRVAVLGGFIAATAQGQTTTLGRGGSDLTAALVGAALDAERVEIWTDVDGIRSTDPRLYRHTRHIESIGFQEAAELAQLGAKVLHPATLIPAMEKNIPVYVLNSRNSRHPGTCVSAERRGPAGVKAIAVKRGITLVGASTARSFRPSLLASEMLALLEAKGCLPDIVSIGHTTVTLTVDNKEALACLRQQFEKRATIKAENSKALISLVAEDIHQIPGLSAQVFSALDGIEVWLALTSGSPRSLSLITSERDMPEAVRRLHNSLLEDNRPQLALGTEEGVASDVSA
jgi:aspartate kinase